LDSETFYAPAVTTRNTLSPPFVSDTDFYYAPRVAGQAPLAPTMYADNEAFYVPTVRTGLRHATVPALFADTDSVVSPDVAAFSPTIFPPLVVDNDTLTIGDGINVTPTGSHFLPALYADADAFYVPVVLGVKTLSPGIVTDADTYPHARGLARCCHTAASSVRCRRPVLAGDPRRQRQARSGVAAACCGRRVLQSEPKHQRLHCGALSPSRAARGSTPRHSGHEAANGVDLVGDDSKVKIELEGNDA
jgi:hypothetical protein